MATGCPRQLTFWSIGRQQVTASPDGGRVVSDAGLLPLRNFEKQLGLIADGPAASRSAFAQVHDPFPGSPAHAADLSDPGRLSDCNDAQSLRDDPLFQTLVEVTPDGTRRLASRSTLNRHQYAYTRRDAELPREERPALMEQRAARSRRPRAAGFIASAPAAAPSHGLQTVSSPANAPPAAPSAEGSAWPPRPRSLSSMPGAAWGTLDTPGSTCVAALPPPPIPMVAGPPPPIVGGPPPPGKLPVRGRGVGELRLGMLGGRVGGSVIEGTSPDGQRGPHHPLDR